MFFIGISQKNEHCEGGVVLYAMPSYMLALTHKNKHLWGSGQSPPQYPRYYTIYSEENVWNTHKNDYYTSRDYLWLPNFQKTSTLKASFPTAFTTVIT